MDGDTELGVNLPRSFREIAVLTVMRDTLRFRKLTSGKTHGKFTKGQAMPSTKVTDSTFDTDVIKSEKPVLVDFWAEWCGPCRMLAPTVDELAQDYKDKIVVGKLNVDDNPNTAMQFGIRSIPTLLLFKNGEVVESIVGLADKTKLQAAIDSALLPENSA